MIFDDFDSWDGMSGFGTIAMLGGWGLTAYLAYALGFQSGIGATEPCTGTTPTCVVQSKHGWFDVGYKTIQALPVQPGDYANMGEQRDKDGMVVILPPVFDAGSTYMILKGQSGIGVVPFPNGVDCGNLAAKMQGECISAAEAKARYWSR